MLAAVTPTASTATALLAADRRSASWDPSSVVLRDRARPGQVVARPRRCVVRRAEPGPCGPLVLEVRAVAGRLECEVWGPRDTPDEAAAAALETAWGWAGAFDTPADLVDVVAGHPVLRRLLRQFGDVRLSWMPRVGEAFGRAVLAQLVTGSEAARSVAQVARSHGSPAPGALWTWPTAAQLGAVPAWTLRRCGVSLRGAGALHAAALADAQLVAAGRDWRALDARLRTLPGVGIWTSAETRLALGDPDALSVGDYHLSKVVGNVMVGVPVDDAGMLELLAPFAGQRGRIARMCELAVRAGMAPREERRGPKVVRSAHRYW
jgi:3-methyladenine DNA glycosylase/8-oxoguanine DNA glycosylase